MIGIIVFLICCAAFGIRVYFIRQTNFDDTPPICVEGDKIYCYNGRALLELPVTDFYSAKGKYKKYFHVLGTFISWGTYNYGKVKIYFDNDGKKEKFVIKNVLEPEQAALDLMEYAENIEQAKNFTDYYKLLRIRTDATQQEILDAYNKMKTQNTDSNDLESIARAYTVLSSPKQKAEYDVQYWSIHSN